VTGVHPSIFIQEEMRARGWSRSELARRMGGDHRFNRLCIDLYFLVGPDEPNLRIGNGENFARAFGVPAEFFRNLETAWLKRVST
jgi:plasmid maintenance system antidote protein VapI